MSRYVLVEWPESQEFVGHPDCHLCTELDNAYFVPEDLYCKTFGRIHQFSWTVENGELQDILSQYPKNAMVAVEYCDVKRLQYFPDRNLIAID